MANWRLSLVLPVYNEAANLGQLVAELRATHDFVSEIILVDNGSHDGSAEALHEAAALDSRFRVLRLDRNAGYGGGVFHGLRHAADESTHVGWMPADGQYSLDDVRRVWLATLAEPWALHKGERLARHDGRDIRAVSAVYSTLARLALGLRVRDVNGLPKIAPRAVIGALGPSPRPTFLFDAEVLAVAARIGLPLREHPVTFLARRAGVSSWSSRRLRTYLETLADLWRLRGEIRAPEPLALGKPVPARD